MGGLFGFLEEFFQFCDSAAKLGELLDGEDLAFGPAVGLGGVAEPFFAIGDIVHDAGLGGDGDAVADFQVA